MTKSGTDQLRGSASLFARDRRWQSLPATYDKSAGSQAAVRSAAGGRVGRRAAGAGQRSGSALLEYRNQDGATLVGTRDVAQRAIRRTFAPAPLDDLLGSARFDWQPERRRRGDGALFRASTRDDTGASTLDRSIGSASYRQSSVNRYQSVVGSWTRILSPTMVNALSTSFSTFHNRIDPVTAEPQLTFPSLVDGASFRVPQGTTRSASR